MKNQLQQRLESLRAEYEAGQKMLADLEERRTQITQTMLRIEGAMQVLREMIETGGQPGEGTTGTVNGA